MKNIPDIMRAIEESEAYARGVTAKFLQELFFIYETKEDIVEFFKDAEENNNPQEHKFDLNGMLVSVHRPSFTLKEYPKFNEYMETKDESMGYWDKTNFHLEICHGYPICIRWDHTDKEAFVWDSESGKEIIPRREESMTELQVLALIEKFQRERGQYEEIINVNTYGQYVSHIKINKMIFELDDAGLDAYIDSFNTIEE